MTSVGDDLAAVLTAVEDWQSRHALASLGALELVPANIDRLYRFETLAEVLAGAWRNDGAEAGLSEVRRVLTTSPLGDTVATQEDLFADVVCEVLAFHGGAYLIAGGLLEQAPFILRQLLGCLVDPAAPAEWRTANIELALATLRLSDHILRSAGFRRYQPPEPRPSVSLPPAREARRLRDLVQLSREQLTGLLAPVSTPDALKPLMSASENVRAPGLLQPYGALSRRPLVVEGDGFVLGTPTVLAAALCHALVTSALEQGVGDDLAAAFRRGVSAEARRAMRTLGMEAVEVELPEPGQLPLTQSVHRFDVDKLASLLVLTDPLEGYKVDDLGGGRWDVDALKDGLLTHIAGVRDALLAQPACDEGLVILAIQSPGREVMLTFDQPEAAPFERLTCEASELGLLAVHEEGESLALWKWARALADLKSATSVMGWHRVDEYGLYRGYGRSYLFPGGRTPHFMSIELDFGRDIRVEAKQRADRHPVAYPDGSVIEVERYDLQGGDVPIYVPRRLPEHRVMFLVEAPDTVWVFGPVEDESPDDSARFPFEEFALTTAYWLWQLGPHIHAVVADLVATRGNLAFVVDVEDPSRWLAGDTEDGKDEDIVDIDITAEGHVHVRFRASAQTALRRSDNEGERTLVSELLHGLRELADANGVDVAPLAEDSLQALVDTVAPLGLKKHLLLPDVRHPELASAGLPAFRPVQEADRALVRAEVGEFLLNRGREAGPVAEEERSALLAEAVTFCRDEITQLLGALRPEGLLEDLIQRNEAVVAEQARRRLTTPTRLACYDGVDRTHARLSEEMPRANLAGICTRYLIEQTAASSPSGSAPLTLARFDRLMALVAEAVELAYLSDAIYYELSPASLRLLHDGRLDVVGQEAYVAGQTAYFAEYVRAEVERNERAFGSHWSDEEAHSDSDPLDTPLQAEIGLSLSDFKSGVVALVDLGRAEGDQPPRALYAKLVTALAQDRGWDEDKARSLIEFLALGPRPDFLHPPSPFTDKDVDPWRFNRGLSFARRPVVVRSDSDGEDEVVWGPRHLFNSSRLVLGLLRSGQYKATTKELRAALGDMAKTRGREFEDVVADTYEAAEFRVLRRVDSIAGHRIADNDGNDLGDIDVLVVDESRRTLYAVDAKDLSVGLTPSDIAREIGRTFKTTGKRDAAVDKHLRRVDWLRDHLGDIHRELGLAHRPRRWGVEPLLVVDQEVASPYLVSPPVPVLSLRQLRERLAKRTASSASKQRTSEQPPNARKGKRRGRRGRRR